MIRANMFLMKTQVIIWLWWSKAHKTIFCLPGLLRWGDVQFMPIWWCWGADLGRFQKVPFKIHFHHPLSKEPALDIGCYRASTQTPGITRSSPRPAGGHKIENRVVGGNMVMLLCRQQLRPALENSRSETRWLILFDYNDDHNGGGVYSLIELLQTKEKEESFKG